MTVYSIYDEEFKAFGRPLGFDTDEIIGEAEKIPFPETGASYTPSVEAFEKLDIFSRAKTYIFGELQAQFGYCCGHNDVLGALEWHTCSEVNVAVTDLILLLGERKDLEDGCRYGSSKIKAFRLKKGECIEVYATTLHFTPVQVEKSGFGCVVGLLKGTNTPLEKPASDELLYRNNKWLICHEENQALIAKGVKKGIYGENYRF